MPFAANAGSVAPWPTLPYLYPLLSQPQTHYTAAPQLTNNDAIAAPLEHLESAKYWGAGPTSQGAGGEHPASSLYLSPVPRAPDWNFVSTDPADSETQMFVAPPSPTSWGAYAAGSAAEPSSANEAAQAQEARDAAAMRLRRRERAAAVARFASPAPDLELDAGEPSFRERARLNLLELLIPAARCSVLGISRLWRTGRSRLTSPTSNAPTTVCARITGRSSPIARYDHMRPFGNVGEFGAAVLGQLGGGMLSPESWLGLGAKGATWLWRAAKAGLQQGAVDAATDPVVQGLNIGAGVQDQYDPRRTAIAGGTGFLAGASGKALVEALSPARFFDPRLTKAEQVVVNRHVGRAWEERAADQRWQLGLVDVSPQITLMPPGGPPTRVDLMARNPVTGTIHCFECKSSKSAPLTKDRGKLFPGLSKAEQRSWAQASQHSRVEAQFLQPRSNSWCGRRSKKWL